MKRILLSGLFAMLLFSSSHLSAEEEKELNATVLGYDTGWIILKSAKTFDVYLSDQVQEGCWTDLSGAQNAVELQLIRSGYETRDSEDASIFTPNVTISAVGYEVGSLGLCAVSVELLVEVPDFGEFETDVGALRSMYDKTVVSYNAIMTSKKSDSNSRIRGQFEAMTQQFLVDIERVKQQMRNALIEQEKSAGTSYWIEQLR